MSATRFSMLKRLAEALDKRTEEIPSSEVAGYFRIDYGNA